MGYTPNATAGLMSADGTQLLFSVGDIIGGSEEDDLGNGVSSGLAMMPLNVLSLETEELSISNPNVSVYPNPGYDQITIEFGSDWPEIIELELVDSQGKMVMSKSIIAFRPAQLDISSLKMGVYLLRVMDSKAQVFAQKRIIKLN